MKIKKQLNRYLYLDTIRKTIQNFFRYNITYTNPRKYGYLGQNVILEPAKSIVDFKNLYFYDSVKVRSGLKVIGVTGKFIVKKYSAIAFNLTVITGNHKPTVGIPHIILGGSHINDKEKDIIIEEELWVGANCTLLSGAHLERGCIIGACSMVNKKIPPYAVAVGSPVKIIAAVFTVEEILKHEERIYPKEERFSKEYLENIFAEYYENKKTIGVDHMEPDDYIKEELTKKRMNIKY